MKQSWNPKIPKLSYFFVVINCSFSIILESNNAYFVIGKYGEDFGWVSEADNPYTAQPGPCKTPKTATRFYVSKYEYLGGYYGACNEDLMRHELVANGPFSIAFEVYADFFQYTGGIYHHITDLKDDLNNPYARLGLQRGFNPFEQSNHAVLLVGFGVDPLSGEKFWVCPFSAIIFILLFV